MKMATYVPRKGDVIAGTFGPQSGHEQRGRRPALVVSKDLFNRHTGQAAHHHVMEGGGAY